jgi:hypothetical protein
MTSNFRRLLDDFVIIWRIYVLSELCKLTKTDGWEDRWVKSDWKKDDNTAGEWNHTSGKWNGDADDKGENRHPYGH